VSPSRSDFTWFVARPVSLTGLESFLGPQRTTAGHATQITKTGDKCGRYIADARQIAQEQNEGVAREIMLPGMLRHLRAPLALPVLHPPE